MVQFSSFFRDLDKQSLKNMQWKYYKVPEYAKTDDAWRIPLAKKEEKRARREEKEANTDPVEKQSEILYVHNADIGVTLPAAPD
jgi:hypothetical protein